MITKLAMRNFRGQKETTLEFGSGVNKLIGPNESGKTTVGHAIAFAYYGSDLYGNTRGIDHLINFGAERGEVILQTEKATLHRAKKRGGTSTLKIGVRGMPMVAADQSSLAERLGMSLEVFASCFAAGYFMKSLDDKRRMEVLGQIARVDRKALLASLMPSVPHTYPKCIKLENPRIDAQNVATERRIKQNQLSADQGALSQIELQLKEMLADAGDKNIEDLTAEIESLRAKQDLFGIYNQELQAYRLAETRAKDAAESNQRKAAERTRIEAEIRALGKEPKHNFADNWSAKETEKQIEELRLKIQAIPPQPSLPAQTPAEPTCTRCGQIIPEKLRASIGQEREKIINGYNEQCRKIADQNNIVKDEIEALSKKLRQENDRILNEQREADAWKVRNQSLQTRLKDLVQVEIRVPAAPEKPEGDETAIRNRLQELTGKQFAIKQMKSRYDSSVQRKRELENEVQSKTLEVQQLKTFEDALLKMPEAETRQMLDRLAMKDVNISLVEGRFSVTDPQMVPYECLSSGRQMKVDIEIAKTFQKLKGGHPGFMFFDNSDLVDEYESLLPPGMQVLIAKVDPSVQTVTVVN